MIRRWVKILPYWLVVRVCRRFTGSYGKLNDEPVRYFRIDGGEFVVFSKELQDKYDEKQRRIKIKKVDKDMNKIRTKLDGDYELRERLRDELNEEERK